MLTLIFSLVIAAVIGAPVWVLYSPIGSIFPALFAFGLSYFLISRSLSKKLEASMRLAQSELQKNRIKRGLDLLEEIKRRYGKWQFFTSSAIDGQIGSIYYFRQDYIRARPYLERAFVRHWMAKGMLGVLHYRKKEFDKMDKVFERAARYSGKQGLLWSLWAYCHHRAGHNDKALEILQRGSKQLSGDDEKLQANLIALQNKKKMKMRGYGEAWYQFQLELSPMMRQQQSGRVKFARR